MEADAELRVGSVEIMKDYSGGDSWRPAVRVSCSRGRATKGEWERGDMLWGERASRATSWPSHPIEGGGRRWHSTFQGVSTQLL
jgi:hypothetical protein